MKSVHHKCLSKEESKNMVSVGKAFKPVTNYTKDDFLTPGKVAEKFKISTEKAKNLMQSLERRHSSFSLNGHLAYIVTTMGHKNCYYLHPMALEAFKQHLDKQKG